MHSQLLVLALLAACAGLGMGLLLAVLAHRKLARDAQLQARKLEAAATDRDEFLTVLSHELRNPLGAIAAAAQVLDSDGTDGETAAEARAVIARQTRALSHTLGELLDLSRLVAGKTALARQPLDLAAMGRSIEQGLVRACAVHGHRLSCRLEPAWSAGDAARLELALTRVLTDELAAMPPGREVLLSVQSEGGLALLRVEFDAQGSGDPGLALTVARRLVELHGGTLGRQASGNGIVFTACLPSYPSPVVTGDS